MDFLNQLNLDEGRDLYEQCEEICPYYDEVIKNRKYGVVNLIKKSFSNENNNFQLVIAGAGLDALGIEVTEHYSNTKVFELDNENTEFKYNLYRNLGNRSKSNIVFIETDLLNPSSVHKSLSAHGWEPMKPTLLLFEGISYYLPAESIQKLVHAIKPNWIIFEFLKHDDKIASDKVNIAKRVFDLILSRCKLSYINRYNYSGIEKLFDNMSVVDRCSMKFLEKMRT
ncbi:MAG: class I SAM-dependent methyltransferase, partial [Deltaproteobacteria bacterium]|nr:class I SAM-dependent methyltransferase [Deltaproteobacteria bacterium]